MADFDEIEETWELPVTVPEVIEQIKALRVHCGDTFVDVYEDRATGTWRGWQHGDSVTEVRLDDYAGAVVDARKVARDQERRRLLMRAMDEALAADPGEEVSRG